MSMRFTTLFGLLPLVLGLLLVASAASAEGDPDRGKSLVYTCTGCHGIAHYKNIYPTYSVPRIKGQNYGYLVEALTAYRTGQRQHPTMNAQAGTLSDQDIRDIAAYIANATEDPS